ncbi:MAG: hypothetical protein RMK29_22185 [Myxococcales bacterium]|nr:hypothetical protein [Myxococcota bacterium]MDW8284425.1 hypothetical protein [Myxococcales bacterium]
MRELAGLLFCAGLAAARPAMACSPPRPDTVRLNPFRAQGGGQLPDRDLPLLPPNLDFELTVLHVYALDAASLVLTREGVGKAAPMPVQVSREGVALRVRIRPAVPLPADTRFSVLGRMGGRQVRLFQFRTSKVVDSGAPSLAEVRDVRSLAAFQPAIGSCDTGEPRVLLTLGEVRDDATPRSQLRYLVEGAGAPRLLDALCGRIELRLGQGERPPGRLRVTPVDLAGNRGQSVEVPVPPQVPADAEALRVTGPCLGD